MVCTNADLYRANNLSSPASVLTTSPPASAAASGLAALSDTSYRLVRGAAHPIDELERCRKNCRGESWELVVSLSRGDVGNCCVR